jgi:three-Cys-motif partner protein
MSFIDDGLFTPTVGPWAVEKYKLLSTYAEIFATSMKDKWDKRVYIDLFAGAGKSRIRESRRIVYASPLLAMGVSHPFDKYVLCEIKQRSYDALEKRVKNEFSQLNQSVLCGDANEHAEEVVRQISDFSTGTKVLTFCFVDPYRLRDLRFDTIKTLAQRYVDFLILIPTGMDAMRNMKQYQRATNKTVEEFLGDPGWRTK